jgi:hypothetical protein
MGKMFRDKNTFSDTSLAFFRNLTEERTEQNKNLSAT